MSIYKEKKVLPISSVVELTELSERQIRYYEERNLISPLRTSGGTRKYSFNDVEKLIDISKKIKEGKSTFSIRQDEKIKTTRTISDSEIRRQMLAGQLNVTFRNHMKK